jgi:hypothetical protein
MRSDGTRKRDGTIELILSIVPAQSFDYLHDRPVGVGSQEPADR